MQTETLENTTGLSVSKGNGIVAGRTPLFLNSDHRLWFRKVRKLSRRVRSCQHPCPTDLLLEKSSPSKRSLGPTRRSAAASSPRRPSGRGASSPWVLPARPPRAPSRSPSASPGRRSVPALSAPRERPTRRRGPGSGPAPRAARAPPPPRAPSSTRAAPTPTWAGSGPRLPPLPGAWEGASSSPRLRGLPGTRRAPPWPGAGRVGEGEQSAHLGTDSPGPWNRSDSPSVLEQIHLIFKAPCPLPASLRTSPAYVGLLPPAGSGLKISIGFRSERERDSWSCLPVPIHFGCSENWGLRLRESLEPLLPVLPSRSWKSWLGSLGGCILTTFTWTASKDVLCIVMPSSPSTGAQSKCPLILLI